jgi:glycine betaine/proline transport system ATP-binding protein
VRPETPINEIFAEQEFPVAVTDEEEHLQGLIVRGSLLAALAEGRLSS